MNIPAQKQFNFNQCSKALDIKGFIPFYETGLGRAYLADSLKLMENIPDGTVNLAITSPPYALHFKKEYGNVSKQEYVQWFLAFAYQIKRILTEDGSFVLNIGGSFNKGEPTRSLYHYKLLIELVDTVGFNLAQELFWYNPAKMPVPAEWVTVRRIRVKDSVENVFWLSKTPWPKASNRKILRPYGEDMKRLNKKGLAKTVRPSGHNINESWKNVDAGGSIPPNVIEEEYADDMLKFGNNAANDLYTKKCKEAGLGIHPARFPASLPEFFIKFLTDECDIVIDPFAGSNTTGAVAERLNRRWISGEIDIDYLEASKFRFNDKQILTLNTFANL